MNIIFQTDGSYAYVILRAGLAITFFFHGTRHVFGWHGGRGFQGMIKNWTEKYRLPKPICILGMFTEMSAVLAMTFGFLVRPAALGLAAFMFIVMIKAHWGNGFFLSQGHDRGSGIEYCLALLLMSVALVIGGAGALSIDGWLSR
jgi:putative oxidoreductase